MTRAAYASTSAPAQQRFALPGLQLAFDSAFETVLLAARRDRLDKAITEIAVHSE